MTNYWLGNKNDVDQVFTITISIEYHELLLVSIQWPIQWRFPFSNALNDISDIPILFIREFERFLLINIGIS